jgi:hypothetical protein
MTKKDIHLVNSEAGDWQGLYINGKLWREGHSLSVRDIVEAIMTEGMTYRVSEVVMEDGNLPQTIEELGL